MSRPVVIASVISIGLHLGFLFLVPGPAWKQVKIERPAHDVEWVQASIPAPLAVRDTPAEPRPTPHPAPPAPRVPTYESSHIAPFDQQQADQAIDHATAGVGLQLGLPKLQMPPLTQDEVVTTVLPLPTTTAADVVAALLKASPPADQPDAALKPIGLDPVELGEKHSPSQWHLPKLDADLMATPLPVSVPVLAPADTEFGIQGPVATREAILQPSLPEVVVRTESEITLKFWVRPDGVVSRIVPVRKGDAALEAAAIRYLQDWRFTALSQYDLQEEQWGTMTVRFLLPRR